MTTNNTAFGDIVTSKVKSRRDQGSDFVIEGWVKTVCRDSEGNIKWVDEGPNRVVNGGIDWILTNDLAGTATIYVGLMTGTPSPLATWVLSDAVAIEAAGYSAGTRPTWGQGEPSTQAVTNAAAVSYTMDGTDTTIGGAFLVEGNSTKDNSASGTLIAAKEFTGGDKTVGNGDTLEVTYTITGSSA